MFPPQSAAGASHVPHSPGHILVPDRSAEFGKTMQEKTGGLCW